MKTEKTRKSLIKVPYVWSPVALTSRRESESEQGKHDMSKTLKHFVQEHLSKRNVSQTFISSKSCFKKRRRQLRGSHPTLRHHFTSFAINVLIEETPGGRNVMNRSQDASCSHVANTVPALALTVTHAGKHEEEGFKKSCFFLSYIIQRRVRYGAHGEKTNRSRLQVTSGKCSRKDRSSGKNINLLDDPTTSKFNAELKSLSSFWPPLWRNHWHHDSVKELNFLINSLTGSELNLNELRQG